MRDVRVQFSIPYGLFWGKDTVDVCYKGIAAQVTFERKFVKDSPMGSFDHTEITRDRQGLSSITLIECYLELNVDLGQDNNYYFHQAITVVNRMLEIYRLYYKEFHVTPIKESLISDKRITYSDERTQNTQLVWSVPGGITLARQIPINDEVRALLKNQDEFPLWKIALLNAENYYDLEEYRETIIEANIALENFVHEHIYDRLSHLSKESIDDFLEEKSDCVNCSLQEDRSNPHIEIGEHPPWLHSVIKFMYSNKPITNLSSNKFRRIIRQITQYRNDIIHGRRKLITEQDANNALQGVKELIEKSLLD